MTVQTKKMNESSFAKIVKELNANAELIRTRQDEKQAVLNDFDKEKNRYKTGKISEKALESSVIKTNKELKKIDESVRSSMRNVNALTMQARRVVSKQSPKTMRVVSGHKKRRVGKRKKK